MDLSTHQGDKDPRQLHREGPGHLHGALSEEMLSLERFFHWGNAPIHSNGCHSASMDGCQQSPAAATPPLLAGSGSSRLLPLPEVEEGARWHLVNSRDPQEGLGRSHQKYTGIDEFAIAFRK